MGLFKMYLWGYLKCIYWVIKNEFMGLFKMYLWGYLKCIYGVI